MCERRLSRLVLGAVLLLLAAGPALSQQDRYERMAAPGVKYTRLYRPAGPWAIHILDVDTSKAYVQVATAVACGKVAGVEPLSGSAARVSTDQRYAVAGVNGDFFIRSASGQGDPLGVQVARGEIVSSPMGRSALLMFRDGRFRIAVPTLEAWVEAESGKRQIDGINQKRSQNELVLCTPRYDSSTNTAQWGTEATLIPADVRPHHGTIEAVVTSVVTGQGDTPIPPYGWVLSGSGSASLFLRSLEPGEKVRLSFRLSPDGENVVEAMGGGPRIVRDGAVAVEAQAESFSGDFALQRHPRTAVGLKGKRLVLVAVDGRQPPYSVGMSLTELANLMIELGCDQAMNLDGGGSTTLWMRGQVQNAPSDGRERPVGNDLVVFSTAPKGPPARMVLEPDSIRILAGQTARLSWRAEDEYYNPVDTSEPLAWETDGLGSVNEAGEFTARAERSLPSRGGSAETEPLHGKITATFAGVSASIPVTVYASPPSLTVHPDEVRLMPGQVQPFTLSVTDSQGRPISFDPQRVAWEASGGIGQFIGAGVLRAGESNARGRVQATLAGSSTQAVVTVGSVSDVVEDFEHPGDWSAFAWPEEVRGSFSREKVDGGKLWAGMLKYDFTGADVTCAAYARFDRPIGAASALKVRVRGDGSGHWLRARLKDSAGNRIVVDLARHVDWKDEWRWVRADIPAAPEPLTLEAIYLAETDPARRDAGDICIDDVEVERPG